MKKANVWSKGGKITMGVLAFFLVVIVGMDVDKGFFISNHPPTREQLAAQASMAEAKKVALEKAEQEQLRVEGMKRAEKLNEAAGQIYDEKLGLCFDVILTYVTSEHQELERHEIPCSRSVMEQTSKGIRNRLRLTQNEWIVEPIPPPVK